MKKSVLIALFMGILTFVLGIAAFAQGETEAAEKSGLWNWVITVGLGGVISMFPALWKKVKGFVGKLTGFILLVLGELDEVRTQVEESSAAARSLIEHYKVALADDKLTKEEQEGFIEKYEKLIDELDDVPPAFKSAVKRIKGYVSTWNK